MKTVLVIPDAHVTPNTNLRRFTWLANLIEDRRPDLIVQLGDFATMESLSHWDQNKRLLIEGRRIKEDLGSARQAWNEVETKLFSIQRQQRKSKTKLYQPELLWFEGNHECVAKDTEILTTEGWIKAEEIKRTHNVASYNIYSKKISFSPPRALAYVADQNMYHVSGMLSNELVSEYHNIDFEDTLTKVSSLKETKFSQTSMTYAGWGEREWFPLPSKDGYLGFENDELIKLLVWTVCDGTVVHKSWFNKRVQFKLSKPDKIQKLRELLDKNKVKYTFREATKSGVNKLQPYYICLYGDWARWVTSLLGEQKEFPKGFARLHGHQFRDFLEALEATDGCRDWNHIDFNTTSKHNADIVQLACIVNGIPCRIDTIQNASGFANGKTQYRVVIFDKGLDSRKKVQVCATGTREDVIAITTKDGTLITRRNGTVAFTGNCWLRQWIERNPEMEGMIDLQTELGITPSLYSKFDWVPWKENRVDEEILYCHVPIGRTGPISSKYITARAIADYSNISCIFGHTHRRQDDSIARITRDGELTTIRAVNVGCFFEEWPHYALGNSNDYWQGLTILNVYEPGLFDVEEWGIVRLGNVYG